MRDEDRGWYAPRKEGRMQSSEGNVFTALIWALALDIAILGGIAVGVLSQH